MVTTTPRPTKTLKKILARRDTIVTRGSSIDNRANLAPEFFESLLAEYEGTRLGRQELHAEILDDTEGALWTRRLIDRAIEIGATHKPSDIRRIVVAVDPAISDGELSAETGIVVAAILHDGTYIVLEDCSMRGTPHQGAVAAIDAFDRWGSDRLIAEANQGGDMVSTVLHAVRASVPVKLVHASKGKRTRSEPVAALYEQGKVGHLKPFPKLEDQLCTFTGLSGERSPDRYDALVWAISELMGAPPVANITINPSIGHIENPWSV